MLTRGVQMQIKIFAKPGHKKMKAKPHRKENIHTILSNFYVKKKSRWNMKLITYLKEKKLHYKGRIQKPPVQQIKCECLLKGNCFQNN